MRWLADGCIDQREQNAGDDLQIEDDRGRAAKDVPPARCARGHLVLGGFDDGRAEPEALLEPVVEIDGALF